MQAVGEASPLTARKHHRFTEEADLLKQALDWLAALGLEVPTLSTAADFADCWLLGRAADVVQAVRRGTEPERAAAPSTHQRRPFKDRIHDFLRWQQLCQELGVRADLLPALADLDAGQGTSSVAACIWAVADKCAALGLQVPAFGGADGRSSLRRSMSRQASARRAELFLHGGSSPPKLPAMPLLTPRAFHGRAGTPNPLSQSSALRNSNGSMREWMHDRKAAAGHQQQEAEPQQQQPIYSGLGRTIAALERASGQGGSLSSPGAPASTPPARAQQQQHADARAQDYQQQAQQAQGQQQQWRRPALPRLDVAAAMAHAAAEAREEDVGEGGEASGWAPQGAAGFLSPLSSPGSPTGSLASTGYTSSVQSSPARCFSPAVRPSPTRFVAMTPSTLHLAAHANPLWSQSPEAGEAAPMPQEAAPGTGGSSAAGSSVWRSPEPAYLSSHSAGATPASSAAPAPASSRSLFEEHVAEAGAGAGVSPEAGSGTPAAEAPGADSVGGGVGRPRMSRSLRDSFEGCGGDDHGGLLESLLSPPDLKPAHTRLLGALMHTSGGGGGSRAAAAAAAAAAAREEREAEEDEEEDEVRGALVLPAGEPAGVQAQVEERAAEPALPAAASQQAKQQTPPAAAAATPNRGSSRGSVRRFALLALGAVASAAAALAAGAVQQQRRGGGGAGKRQHGPTPFRHPQPVPPLHSASHLRVMSSHTGQPQGRKGAAASSSSSSSGGSGRPAGSAGPPCWDNPHALLTRG